jgi:hypothetical protein
MIDEGLSLRQVQAARPTRDYDARYGAARRILDTAQFVEAVYDSLASEPKER